MPVINVSHIIRLVELNKENEINFDLDFNLKSKNGEQFQILITDQKTLDEEDNSNLQYQTVNGSISGTMKSDKNIYKKYILVLKSQNPCEVDVNFNINLLPDYIQQPEDLKPVEMVPDNNYNNYNDNNKESTISWRLILIFIVILLGIFFIFYIYKKDKVSCDNDMNVCINNNLKDSTMDIFEKLKTIPMY